MIHVASSALTDRPPAIWLSETLAIDVSSTSMNVAMLITATISQGLRLPAAERSAFHCSAATATFSAP